MAAWKQPMWEGCYHECVHVWILICSPHSQRWCRCGVINVGGDTFDDRLRENDRSVGAPTEDLPDAAAVRAKLVSSQRPSTDAAPTVRPDLDAPDANAHRIGPLTHCRGYFNPEGGWAEAARAVAILLVHVKAMGGKVITNRAVTGLVKDTHGHTAGVTCSDGACVEADRVILTIGAWTASTFPKLHLDGKCLATG